MEHKKKKYSTLVLKQISSTKEYLNTLSVQISHNNNLLNWFKGLCAQLTKLIVLLTDFHKIIDKNIEYKETLLLYLHQLLTILSLLINIFVRESALDQPLSEIRFFCKKQMLWSLDGIFETITKNSYLQNSKANFISWMDIAIEKINLIDFVNVEQASMDFNETKKIFEEVLSHAMSLAQVTLEEEYKMIRGSSQTVLDALGSLSKEMNKIKPNTAMLNLFVDTCKNKLCALEHKVNTAVLKLSLKVFSEYTLPLEAIHNFCFDKTNKGDQEKLDELIVEFDLHVDRLLQIGLFAISCSSCPNNCSKIRSSMASLEALETELVPAFTSVLLDFNLSNSHLALLLKDHWINQAQILQRLIYLIIDPSAFCEVIFEENKLLIDEMLDTFKVHFILNENCFKKFMRQSNILMDFMTIILEEEQEINIEDVKGVLTEFKYVLHEVQSAYDILPQKKTSYMRILKRCKILLKSIKYLWNCFIDENQSVSIKEKCYGDKSPVTDHSTNLDYIVARGQQILKDRSILYRTEIKNGTFKMHNQGDNSSYVNGTKLMSSLKLVHLRNRTFINSNKTSTKLQMSDILNELNNLTHVSLNKTVHIKK
ncbi:unnamed protein product [Psylliodes chrysocephalus]|uniref:Serendipity locus protein alpha n=1 Tax=Psylliodes chrysocephalus TaxID=3402493 RepID=A0A9P0CPV0_9CUCU|nr:unnamed protein product [Psylliodes chrysocephala]